MAHHDAFFRTQERPFRATNPASAPPPLDRVQLLLQRGLLVCHLIRLFSRHHTRRCSVSMGRFSQRWRFRTDAAVTLTTTTGGEILSKRQELTRKRKHSRSALYGRRCTFPTAAHTTTTGSATVILRLVGSSSCSPNTKLYQHHRPNKSGLVVVDTSTPTAIDAPPRRSVRRHHAKRQYRIANGLS
jgi:hypothetical protein